MENIVADLATERGHLIVGFSAVRDVEIAIRAQFDGWIADPDVDMVIVVGKSEALARALAPVVEERLSGYPEVSDAVRCGATLVFVLPPNADAVRAAMETRILPELD